MPARKLKEFLEQQHVPYSCIRHPTAYTAQEIAAAAHVPGREMAKTVIVELDGRIAMVVLPANQKIILQDLRELTGADQLRFLHEDEFKNLFPDCEVGAMPPFGNLYGMDVYVANGLTQDDEIAFNAGSHDELVRMHYRDYENLVHPHVMSFTT